MPWCWVRENCVWYYGMGWNPKESNYIRVWKVLLINLILLCWPPSNSRQLPYCCSSLCLCLLVLTWSEAQTVIWTWSNLGRTTTTSLSHLFWMILVGRWWVSEYACRLRLIVSQTQVDFKAEEYVDSAYITYIQDRVLRQLYKKLKHGKSWK